jgi:hypothetical protein
MNEMFEPQTNVRFVLTKCQVNQVTINRNLGPFITWLNQDGDEGSQVIANRDRSVKLNVFFVWELRAGSDNPRDLDQGEAATMLVTGRGQEQPFLTRFPPIHWSRTTHPQRPVSRWHTKQGISCWDVGTAITTRPWVL